MSVATMDEKIVGVSVHDIKPGHESNFQNIIIHSFEFPVAWAATSRLDHRLLA